MPQIGVTRVGEVTHLDRNGIPNFVAVRPRDMDPGISYYNGKGSTRAQARASAMMEAIERYSGEVCDLTVIRGSYRQMRRNALAVDPRQLLVPQVRPYRADMPLEWVLGFELLSSRPVFVPRNAVVCPYRPGPGSVELFYASTNGLASGNTLAEALSHGLCEVNERDALSLAHAGMELRPAVGRLLAGLARATPRGRAPTATPLIEQEDLPTRASCLVGKLRRAGLQIFLRDVTSDTGIPAIDCTLVERTGHEQYVCHGGFGSHPDARVALTRALTEAAQSRVGCIQGGREDLPEFADLGSRRIDPEALFGSPRRVRFAQVASRHHDDVADDVRWILQRLRRAGFKQIVAVDLTRPELQIPVVRVVVPGAEAWTVFHLHTGRGVIGRRVARRLA